MVRGPPSAGGLHGDQQVPGQAVCSPAGEDAHGEQVTPKCSACQCVAWGMQLGTVHVVSGGPARLSGAGFHLRDLGLLGQTSSQLRRLSLGKKAFVKTWLPKASVMGFASLFPYCLQ